MRFIFSSSYRIYSVLRNMLLSAFISMVTVVEFHNRKRNSIVCQWRNLDIFSALLDGMRQSYVYISLRWYLASLLKIKMLLILLSNKKTVFRIFALKDWWWILIPPFLTYSSISRKNLKFLWVLISILMYFALV